MITRTITVWILCVTGLKGVLASQAAISHQVTASEAAEKERSGRAGSTINLIPLPKLRPAEASTSTQALNIYARDLYSLHARVYFKRLILENDKALKEVAGFASLDPKLANREWLQVGEEGTLSQIQARFNELAQTYMVLQQGELAARRQLKKMCTAGENGAALLDPDKKRILCNQYLEILAAVVENQLGVIDSNLLFRSDNPQLRLEEPSGWRKHSQAVLKQLMEDDPDNKQSYQLHQIAMTKDANPSFISKIVNSFKAGSSKANDAPSPKCNDSSVHSKSADSSPSSKASDPPPPSKTSNSPSSVHQSKSAVASSKPSPRSNPPAMSLRKTVIVTSPITLTEDPSSLKDLEAVLKRTLTQAAQSCPN